jgi:AAA domain/DnaB-like helicase N terminal domain
VSRDRIPPHNVDAEAARGLSRRGMSRDRIPPHDDAAEAAIFAAVIIATNGLVDDLLAQGLEPSHFYRPDHQTAWDAITHLRAAGEAVDHITLTAELRRVGMDDDRIVDIVQANGGSTSAVPSYVARIRENAERRRMIHLASQISQAAYDGSDPSPAIERLGALTAAGGRVDRLRQRLHVGGAVRSIPAPTALVDGLLFTPGVSFIYGPPKVGKSFFALDLALSVATGRRFMGRETHAGCVLYVAAEGVGGLGPRVDAWCEFHRVPGEQLAATSWLTTAVNLSVESDVASLERFARELQPVLIVLDTLARCTVGVEENSARDMGVVVGALDRLRDAIDGHICVVHHAGKNVAAGLRGTTALRGAADTVISLTGDAKATEVKVEDQKDAEPARPWWCQLAPCSSSVVIVPASGVERLAPSILAVMDALRTLPDEDRTASKWQAVAEEMGVSRRTFFDAKKVLLKQRAVLGGGKRGALYTIPEPDGEES